MQTPRHPAISVVMPVFNVEHYVGDAIRSVLAQSFTDFELIIVDDGGTDRSMAICESFDDPRLRIKGQANRGLAGARNTGIALARGRYIALLDSDDMFLPGKLARHAAYLDAHPDIGVTYGASALISAAGRRLNITQTPKPGRAAARDVFCGRAIPNGSAPVFRRDMLAEAARPGPDSRAWIFDETLRRSEDVECWTRLALTSRFGFMALPGTDTLYRVNAGGLSADVIRQLDSWEDVCARLAALAPGFIAAHAPEARARELRYLARRCVQNRDRGLGLTLAAAALRHDRSLLWREPAKTLTTLAACAALRALPAAGFGSLMRLARPIAAAAAP